MMLPNFLLLMLLWMTTMFAAQTVATGPPKVTCNFCTDPKKVTKPKAKFTLLQAFGIFPITVSCGYWDYLMKSGVAEARCVYNQNEAYRQAACGCA